MQSAFADPEESSTLWWEEEVALFREWMVCFLCLKRMGSSGCFLDFKRGSVTVLWNLMIISIICVCILSSSCFHDPFTLPFACCIPSHMYVLPIQSPHLVCLFWSLFYSWLTKDWAEFGSEYLLSSNEWFLVNVYRTSGNDSIMVYLGPFGIRWQKYLQRGAEQEERGQTCLNLT